MHNISTARLFGVGQFLLIGRLEREIWEHGEIMEYKVTLANFPKLLNLPPFTLTNITYYITTIKVPIFATW